MQLYSTHHLSCQQKLRFLHLFMTNFKFYSSPVNGNLANPTPRNKIHFCSILYVSKALEPSWYFKKQKKIDESSGGRVSIRMRVQKFGKKGEPDCFSRNLFCPFWLIRFALTLYSYALLLLYLQILVLGFPQNCSANKMCQEQELSAASTQYKLNFRVYGPKIKILIFVLHMYLHFWGICAHNQQ